MTLKELRISYGISQLEASKAIDVPLRTYIRYENDENYGDSFKREIFVERLNNKYMITEEKGILTIEQIKKIVREVVLTKYKNEIDLVLLFGSYSRGEARDNSDVDLCVSSNLKGFAFFGMMESFRQALHKEVDVIEIKHLKDQTLLLEILKDRIKLYDKEEEEELSE